MKNREIKFRAWDKKEKKIIEIYSMDACLSGGDFSKAHEDIILQQFTGLKDKNGKEIYEGDLIKSDYGDIFEMEWRLILTEKEVEIIGNIYENPELLTNNQRSGEELKEKEKITWKN